MRTPRYPRTDRVRTYSNRGWVIPSEDGEAILAKTLLPSMTQEQHAKYHARGFRAMSAIYSIRDVMHAAYRLRENGGQVEEVRDYLRTVFRENQVQTQTRAISMPGRKYDKVIHGCYTTNPLEDFANLAIGDGEMERGLSDGDSRALTGLSFNELVAVLNWINGTRASYVHKIDPSLVVNAPERVVGFGADNERAWVTCNRAPDDYVALARIIRSGNDIRSQPIRRNFRTFGEPLEVYPYPRRA